MQLDREDAALEQATAKLRKQLTRDMAQDDDVGTDEQFTDAELAAADAPATLVRKVLDTNIMQDLAETTKSLSSALAACHDRWALHDVRRNGESQSLRGGGGGGGRARDRKRFSYAPAAAATSSSAHHLLSLDETGADELYQEDEARAAARAIRRNEKLLHAATSNDARAVSHLLHHDTTLTDQFQFAATHAASTGGADPEQYGSEDGGTGADFTRTVGIRAPDEDDDEALSMWRGQIGDSYQYV